MTYGGRFFVAPRFTLQLDKYKSFDTTGEGVNVDCDQIEGRVDLGATFSVWGEARVGYYRGNSSGNTEDVAIPYEYDDEEGGWRAVVAFDHLDNADFPRHGWATVANARLSRPGLGADLDYDRAWFQTLAATTTGRLTFITRVEAGTSFESDLPVYHRYELGGFTHMSGLEPGEMQGDEYALAVLGSYVRLTNIGPPLGGNVYLGVLGEAGQTWILDQTTALEGQRIGFSAFLGAETHARTGVSGVRLDGRRG